MALSKTQIGRALCCAALLLVRAGWAGAQPAPSGHVDLELIPAAGGCAVLRLPPRRQRRMMS
jgi:hypothetical protein